jgi:hypothetical protein
MKPKIKFSHDYLKFTGKVLPMDCILLQCFKVSYHDLSEEFIKYDTAYLEDGKIKFYPLPKTDLIVLILSAYNLKHPTAVFEEKLTTIRRFTPQKWKYYKSLEGKEVELVYG